MNALMIVLLVGAFLTAMWASFQISNSGCTLLHLHPLYVAIISFVFWPAALAMLLGGKLARRARRKYSERAAAERST